MDLKGIRKLIITAIFSDDVLYDTLVLKGGNALNIIYQVGARASVDIDLSMSSDFKDLDEIRTRLFSALKDRFDSKGYTIFDESLQPKPTQNPIDPEWGGYQAEFKIIEKEKSSGINRKRLGVHAIAVGDTLSTRVFKIQISKCEFCEGKTELELDDFSCFVYTLPMIAVEKLRAICQQMEEYTRNKRPTPRARDFYDIFSIVQAIALKLDAPENLALLRSIFQIKQVPLELLSKISETRDFHARDWSNLQDTIHDKSKDFNFYFDFVVNEVKRLESFWIE